MASTVWKGHLTFGLVSLPVKLYSAARSETVSFNQLHKHDNSRVKQVLYCQAEDKPIQRSEIVKGYEYEKDKYDVVDEEEIKKVAPKTAKTMEILEFVKSADVDPIYFESSYYMAPDDAGEKPYALLFEALRQSGYCALAKIAMHNREHVVFLRPAKRELSRWAAAMARLCFRAEEAVRNASTRDAAPRAGARAGGRLAAAAPRRLRGVPRPPPGAGDRYPVRRGALRARRRRGHRGCGTAAKRCDRAPTVRRKLR